MDHFQRRNGVLCAEDVPLPEVAAQFGTPTYVYSRATIERHVQVLRQGLTALPHIICYAVKANSNTALLEVLAQCGCGFDAVSQGELVRLHKAGAPFDKVIVSGVGKNDHEIAAALRANVLYICIESEEELRAVARVASNLGLRARVGLRVNPDVDAKTHPYISTGLKKNKFGVPCASALPLCTLAASLNIEVTGVSCHIGSQITTLAPFVDAAGIMVNLVHTLQQAGVPLKHVGVGGGLGVPYRDETPPNPAAYGAALADILGPLNLTLVCEPGRVIVGNAGILLTRVVRLKAGAESKFVIVDAGMNDLMRPALYSAYHDIVPVQAPTVGAPMSAMDVVGPVCESADTFAAGRALPPLAEGDLLAIRTAGAYGFVMASQYNARQLPAEVLCQGASVQVVRERMPMADLWRGERTLDAQPVNSQLPPWYDPEWAIREAP